MAIIVRDNEDELNQHLEEGYSVVSVCAMPSSAAMGGDEGYAQQLTYVPTCLVILQEP